MRIEQMRAKNRSKHAIHIRKKVIEKTHTTTKTENKQQTTIKAKQ